MFKAALGNEHPRVVMSLNNLATVLGRQGKHAEAERIQREALAISRNLKGDPTAIESAIFGLAETLFRQGKFADSGAIYREALQRRSARLPADDLKVVGSAASLARLLADWVWAERGSLSEIRNLKPKISGRAQEAERLLRDCLAARLRGPTATHWRTDETRNRLGGALLAVAVTDPALTSESRAARFTEAEAILVESCEAL